MPKSKDIARCPTCGTDQHVVSRTEEVWTLGCSHVIPAPTPESKGKGKD